MSLGAADGLELVDGTNDGWLEGCAERDGDELGSPLGACVADGLSDGAADGDVLELGRSEGSLLGIWESDGDELGSAEGN